MSKRYLRPFKPSPGIRHLGEPIEEKTFKS
jgi:hypothetical protein